MSFWQWYKSTEEVKLLTEDLKSLRLEHAALKQQYEEIKNPLESNGDNITESEGKAIWSGIDYLAQDPPSYEEVMMLACFNMSMLAKYWAPGKDTGQVVISMIEGLSEAGAEEKHQDLMDSVTEILEKYERQRAEKKDPIGDIEFNEP